MATVILQSCFSDVLPRHSNIMADKRLNLLDECAARSLIGPVRKKSASLFPEGTVKCTHLAAQPIYRGCPVK